MFECPVTQWYETTEKLVQEDEGKDEAEEEDHLGSQARLTWFQLDCF